MKLLRRSRWLWNPGLRVAVLTLLCGAAVPALGQTIPLDCVSAVADAGPGTPEWYARDLNNIFCAVQRHVDQTQHPVGPFPVSTSIEGLAPMPLTDAYRDPSRHDGHRFRFKAVTITNRDGSGLAAEIYRPCAAGTCAGLPADLQTFASPYPAVVVLHGGGSRKELHWWSSQTLAEAGYMVVAFDGAASNRANAEDVLGWLLATPQAPTGRGEFNPFWGELDRQRVGIAGHSQGGQMASVLGQEDPHISAIVSWDRGSSLPLPPAEQLHTPTLFFVGDYACQANPVCQPEPYLEPPPDPRGPGGRGREYEIVSAAGVDSMKIALRASTHLDWVPSEPSGNRYAEIVSVYYTLAWFDRYLKGAADAYARLTASAFDDSADRHNISQGFFDPVKAASSADPYGGNVPYTLKGLPVADRLSFYFPSKCFLSVPDSPDRAVSDDIRANGCGVTP